MTTYPNPTLSGITLPARPNGQLFTDASGRITTSPAFNVLADGADPTGAVDASSIFQTVFNAAGATGGLIVIPPGTYKLGTPVTMTIAAGKGVSIFGSGQDVSVLLSPTGSTVLSITRATADATFHIRDFTVASGAAGTGSGIVVSGGGTSEAANDFTNITVRSSGTSNEGPFYFAIGIQVKAVSNILFSNVQMPGNTGIQGFGVSLLGDPVGLAYGIIYNFSNCLFNFMNTGIVYGSYIQGVQVTNCNFTGNGHGIFVPAGATGSLFELVISSTQFNSTAADIQALTLLSDVNICSSNFGPFSANTSFLSMTGIFGNMTVTGNTFINATGTAAVAIVTASGSANIVIVGNAFIGSWSTGVIFQGTTANANLQSNLYNGPTFPCSPATTTGTIRIGGGSS